MITDLIPPCPICQGIVPRSPRRAPQRQYCSLACANKAKPHPHRRDPSKWETRICPACGDGFTSRVSRPERFCSLACANTQNKGRPKEPDKYTTGTCPTCGKLFQYLLSWPRKYCSNQCKGKANLGNLGVAETRYESSCEQCGKRYMVIPSASKGRFCSLQCAGHWKSDQAGNPHYEPVANPYTSLRKQVALLCEACCAVFWVKLSHVEKRRYCSKACLNHAQGDWLRGESNPRWEGGHLSYYGPSWQRARRIARKRDQNCQRCGKTPQEAGRSLDVHHIIPFRTFGVERHEEANDLSNLMALCNTCHLLVEWETRRTIPMLSC